MNERELIERDIDAYLERHTTKDLLRFITAGSVDDGKSTLIGRLLYDSELVFEDHLEALERDSRRTGHAGEGEIDFALLVDGLRSEREQGITIDVAYRYFSTPRRKFILADAPGHEQYTRNMATGASTADLMIVLVDARHGVLPQTRRHSFIASLLGIRHVVVAVNKMDLVDWSRDVFEAIRADYTAFADRLELTDLHFIPISALRGDNIVRRSENTPWYQGSPLLDYLETVHVASDRNLIDMRFPVQTVIRPDGEFRGFAGTLASGVLRPGDEILALPSRQRSRVRQILGAAGPTERLVPPLTATVTLEDEIDVDRGSVLVHPRNLPRSEPSFEAMLIWMGERPLDPGRPYLVRHASGTVSGAVTSLRYRINVDTFHREDAQRLALNEIGRVRVETQAPLFYDPYRRNRTMGSFILIDRLTHATVAAGTILDVTAGDERDDDAAAGTALSAHASRITLAERADRLNQTPHVVWLTGLPRAGKSTIAFLLERRLFDAGLFPVVIHGTNLRRGLDSDLGFSGLDRSEHVRRVAETARLACEMGMIAIVVVVSPYEADRRAARHLIGPDRFVEVFCDAPIEVCEARDERGLYARARAGTIRNVTGVDAPYERPETPDIVVPSGTDSAEACCDRIVRELVARGLLPDRVASRLGGDGDSR